MILHILRILRTVSNKILKDGAYEISLNPRYAKYGYMFFDNKVQLVLVGLVATSKAGAKVSGNEVLVLELHKPVIKKFKEKKVQVGFKDDIWVLDLVVRRSLSSKNVLGFHCLLLCVIYVFPSYTSSKQFFMVLLK